MKVQVMKWRAVAILTILAVLTVSSTAHASLRSDTRDESVICIDTILGAASGSGDTEIEVRTDGVKANGEDFRVVEDGFGSGYIDMSTALSIAYGCISNIGAIVEAAGASAIIEVSVASTDGSGGYFVTAVGAAGF